MNIYEHAKQVREETKDLLPGQQKRTSQGVFFCTNGGNIQQLVPAYKLAATALDGMSDEEIEQAIQEYLEICEEHGIPQGLTYE